MPHRVLRVLHRVLGVPHRVLRVPHRVLGQYNETPRLRGCVLVNDSRPPTFGVPVFPAAFRIMPSNRQWILRHRPEGVIKPTDLELVTADVPPCGEGEVLSLTPIKNKARPSWDLVALEA